MEINCCSSAPRKLILCSVFEGIISLMTLMFFIATFLDPDSGKGLLIFSSLEWLYPFLWIFNTFSCYGNFNVNEKFIKTAKFVSIMVKLFCLGWSIPFLVYSFIDGLHIVFRVFACIYTFLLIMSLIIEIFMNTKKKRKKVIKQILSSNNAENKNEGIEKKSGNIDMKKDIEMDALNDKKDNDNEINNEDNDGLIKLRRDDEEENVEGAMEDFENQENNKRELMDDKDNKDEGKSDDDQKFGGEEDEGEEKEDKEDNDRINNNLQGSGSHFSNMINNQNNNINLNFNKDNDDNDDDKEDSDEDDNKKQIQISNINGNIQNNNNKNNINNINLNKNKPKHKNAINLGGSLNKPNKSKQNVGGGNIKNSSNSNLKKSSNKNNKGNYNFSSSPNAGKNKKSNINKNKKNLEVKESQYEENEEDDE